MDKIKVNLSYNTYNLLLHDMEDFYFDIDKGSPNKNLFYNTVIKNMYIRKKQDSENTRKKILNLLDDYDISTDELNDILYEIENIYSLKNEDKTNRSHGYYISFRPSKSLLDMYEEIEEFELRSNTISNYYRSLFNEYARLPQDERERVVFDDKLKIINSAITNKKTLIIKLNTQVMECIPYEMVRTNDELYNYLIAGIRTQEGLKFFSLHLFKCTDIIKTKNLYSLSKDEIEQFEEMLVRGPRNIEQRTALIKVRLTKRGKSFFKKFYLNRPIPCAIEDDVYVFNTSVDNLFVYFSRFGKEACILEPSNLRGQMRQFHKRALNLYNNTSEEKENK